jgi:hypothetical protein
LAGNQTGARRDAEWEWRQAVKNNADPKTIAQLKARYDAASAIEDAAMGKNGQVKRH